MMISHGFARSSSIARAACWLTVLAALVLLAACAPPSKSEEEMRKDIQALKADLNALKEKVAKLEAGQQEISELLKKQAAAAAQPAFPGIGKPMPVVPQAPALPAVPATAPLTVSQLLKDKDRYLGARVTVKGPVGPVVVHHKSLLLKSPEGDVEVFFGNLPDKKVVDRLTSVPLEHPITVTGTVSAPQGKGGTAKLQIAAEDVEF